MSDNDRRRFVRFVNDELDAVPLMVRSGASVLSPGMSVEVEVGGRWTTVNGHRARVDGHWVTCVVLAENARELVVELQTVSNPEDAATTSTRHHR
jgi:hypothetical protein